MDHSAIPISVVIPTYNRAKLIQRAITCVLAQTLPCKEILIVDDGSTDDTADVVRSFGPPVRLIPQEHGGPSRARNLGVSEATTGWIAFLDSDDFWNPDYLEHMTGAIKATAGKAAIYFCNVRYDKTPRAHWEKAGFVSPEPVHLITNAATVAMMETHPMLLPFTVFRKDVYQKYGGLLEILWSAEDTHLFIRIGLAEVICAVNRIGGVVTSDESDPRNRLTLEYESGNVRRWRGMVVMYTNLLQTSPSIPSHVRSELRARLAHSYWRIARLSWLGREFRDVLPALSRSLITDCRVAPRVIREAIGRIKGQETGSSPNTPTAAKN
jgi:hypothetical protein